MSAGTAKPIARAAPIAPIVAILAPVTIAVGRLPRYLGNRRHVASGFLAAIARLSSAALLPPTLAHRNVCATVSTPRRMVETGR